MLLLLLLALQLAVDEDRVWRGRVGGRGRGTGRLEGARRVGPAADATVHGGNGDESSEAEATSRTRLGWEDVHYEVRAQVPDGSALRSG